MDLYLTAENFLKDHQYQGNDGYGLRYWRGDFYEWKKKYYQKLSFDDFKNTINTWLANNLAFREKIGSSLILKIIEAIKIFSKVPDNLFWPLWDMGDLGDPDTRGFKEVPSLISFQNGILNLNEYINRRKNKEVINEKLLMPHSEDFLSFNVLPFDFNPQAQCPIYDQMISQILPDVDTINMWHEWCGNHFNFTLPVDKFLILQGGGSNGKSVLLFLLEELLGRNNVSHISLASFQPENFALGETFGKLANICAEMSDLDKVNEATLKAFVTGDVMTINQKYKSPFSFTPKARLTFSTNPLPTFNDKTDGMWRRVMLIQLKNKFNESTANTNFLQGSFWKAQGELPGVFNHALDGLFNLLERGHLKKSDTTIANTEQYRLDSNPIAQFFASQLESDSTESLSMECVFEHYSQWCMRSGYRQMNLANFSRAFWDACRLLEVKVEQDRVMVKGDRKRIARGIKLKLDLN